MLKSSKKGPTSIKKENIELILWHEKCQKVAKNEEENSSEK